jgi:hypothetical protein
MAVSYGCLTYGFLTHDFSIAYVAGKKTTTGDLALSAAHYFEDAGLTARRIPTNIGIIRDPGHPEPWIVAMSAKPGYLSTLDYANRWGIEPMFFDFKSRGFGIGHGWMVRAFAVRAKSRELPGQET